MRFDAMVHMDNISIQQHLQPVDHGGPQEDQENSKQSSDFIFIDENSIYGRGRRAAEERGERPGGSSREIDSITLYPFAHQVGGHTQLLTLDKSTLCKPLVPRELLFYLNVPQELVKFVPAYKGKCEGHDE